MVAGQFWARPFRASSQAVLHPAFVTDIGQINISDCFFPCEMGIIFASGGGVSIICVNLPRAHVACTQHIAAVVTIISSNIYSSRALGVGSKEGKPEGSQKWALSACLNSVWVRGRKSLPFAT